MNALFTNSAHPRHLPDIARPFSIVAAYDNSPGQRKAIRVYAQLSEQFVGMEFHFGYWSFDQLGNHDFAEEAAGVAAHADMVIIAASDVSDLPDHLKLWIEMWLARKGKHDTALVALLACQGNTECQAQRYLERIAEQAELSYFTNPVTGSASATGSSIEAILARAEVTEPVLETILSYPPPSHWGINE